MTYAFGTTTAIAALASLSTITAGQVLTGSGSNLPLGGTPPATENISRSSTQSGFTGTWSSPALPDWVGSFTATGPIPTGTSFPAGTTRYDFTSLPTGVLPTGTFLRIGDLDIGSATNESFVLSASDSSGNAISFEWLDEPAGETGSGTGGGGSILAGDMPAWSWDATQASYTFDGSNVGGNPNIAFLLPTNTDIAFLTVERVSPFANFRLRAPVPAPGAAALLGFGAVAGLRRRSR